MPSKYRAEPNMPGTIWAPPETWPEREPMRMSPRISSMVNNKSGSGRQNAWYITDNHDSSTLAGDNAMDLTQRFLGKLRIGQDTITFSVLSQHHNGLELVLHDDVIKWKPLLRYWPFVREIHRSPVTSPHKGQWRGTLMFSLICARINGWVNNPETADLRRHHAHYDVIVM